MNNIRQMIQEPDPRRPWICFAKILDTSDTALKTRDRLLSELKQELQDMAVLEEQHLFPVLRKHKDLKDLVREAIKGKQRKRRRFWPTSSGPPRDGAEFAKKVATLRKTFQQHVRDEKKELLPAIIATSATRKPHRSSRRWMAARRKSRRPGAQRQSNIEPRPKGSGSRSSRLNG